MGAQGGGGGPGVGATGQDPGETDRSVNDILGDAAEPTEERQERREVTEWLTGYLAQRGGEAIRKDVLKAAHAEGFAERTVQRAQRGAGVTAVRQGFPSVTIWRLNPGHEQ